MASLSDFKKNTSNTNLGNARGKELLKESVDQNGWAGAMLADAQGNILDGNHRMDEADLRGVEPIVIKIDGKRPVILQREDVQPGSAKARVLATLINRSADLNHRYDYDAVSVKVTESGISPLRFGFSIDEISIGQPTESAPPRNGQGADIDNTSDTSDAPTGMAKVPASYQLMIECAGELQQQELYDRLSREGFRCRPLTL